MSTSKCYSVILAAVIVSTAIAYANPTPYTGTESGLIALYHMEDTFAQDSYVTAITNVADTPSQNAYVATAASNSVTSMSGFGNALSVQPNSAISRAGGNDWNDINHTDFTAECWAKWGTGEYDTSVVQGLMYAGAGTNANQYEWRVFAQSGYMYFYWSNGTTQQAVAAEFTPTDDAWYHIAVTLERNDGGTGSTATAKLYLTEAGTDTAQLAASKDDGVWMSSASIDYRFYVGNYIIDQGNRYMRGDMDEVAIFNYAKTADEFTTLVPEPTTLGLALLGAAGLVIRKKRK